MSKKKKKSQQIEKIFPLQMVFWIHLWFSFIAASEV